MERRVADGREAPNIDPEVGDLQAPPIAPPATPDSVGVAELVVGFCIALGAMFVLALAAWSIRYQEVIALDDLASPLVHSVASPTLDTVMNGFTTLGSSPVLGLLSLLAVALLLAHGHRAKALFLATAIAGSVALNGTLKLVIERPRPALPWAHVLPDYSFPSGHTMNSLVVYLALALIAWVTYGRRAGSIAVVAALGMAIAVGFSRIYLGYHYPSDVVGGLAAGLAWLFVVALAFETIPRRWALGHSGRSHGGRAP